MRRERVYVQREGGWWSSYGDGMPMGVGGGG